MYTSFKYFKSISKVNYSFKVGTWFDKVNFISNFNTDWRIIHSFFSKRFNVKKN
jgi:hypothetical protein